MFRAVEPVVDHQGKIDCTDCAKSFSPSMRQVQKFEEQKIPLPSRCPKCKGQICDKFKEDGGCPYGDACKFLHPVGQATIVPTASGDAPKKHSYSCRFYAAGSCMSGDQCRFQHEPREQSGTVMNISEVDPSVLDISEVKEDESLAVEEHKTWSSRFKEFTGVDTSKYRYV